MKKFFDKVLFLSVGATILMALPMSASAQTPNDGDAVATAIAAQIRITRDNLQNVVKRLDALDTSKVYNDPDYKKMALIYKQNVNQAMVRFDNTMTDSIFPKAQYWLSLFKDYFDSNKDNTPYIIAAVDNTNTNLEVVSKLYQQAIAQIFIDVLGRAPAFTTPVIETASIPKDNCQFTPPFGERVKKVQAYSFSYLDFSRNLVTPSAPVCLITTRGKNTVNDYFIQEGRRIPTNYSRDVNDYDSEEFGILITKNWAGGCKTDECRQLRLNDLINFADLLDNVVNAPIPLIYASHTFKLERSVMETGHFRDAVKSAMKGLK